MALFRRSHRQPAAPQPRPALRGRLAQRCLLLLLTFALALGLAACQTEKEDQGSEGSTASPVDIGTAPGASRSGTVGKSPASSYYSATIAAATATRTITLTNLTDDADLIVFTDAGFSNPFCSSALPGTASESCSETTDGVSTKLYIQVKSFSGTGSTFLLTVN